MLSVPGEIIAFFAIVVGLPVAAVFSIPLMMIWTHHQRKMEELRQQRQRMIGDDIRAEFAALRAEIQALRDTTTQYDLSFDNALQQMDRRLTHLERQSRPSIGVEETATQSVILGGRSHSA
ncbi:MAG TPA: hypothetical protein VFB38_24915 [Chthonomonadaceae bacterium]|nr:hypothetical protein [Chthonomonadaceae bacterium]